jgi:cytochrome c556
MTQRLGWTEIRVFKHDLEGEKPFVIEKVRAVLQARQRRAEVPPAEFLG